VDYDVLIFPGGGRFSDAQSEALQGWLRAGGTAVAVGGAAQSMASSLAEMEMRRADEEDLDRDEELAEALKTREERRTDRWEASIPGSILKVKMDPGHPLAAGAGAGGLENELFVLTRGRAFEPSEDFTSVAHFPQDLEAIAGVMFDHGLELLDRSTWMAEAGVGRGSLILFAEDPLFRIFWYSAYQLYTNAILLGPAF
jgi:putative intracellular protease/amidase